MRTDKFTVHQRNLILQAQEIMDEASDGYDEILQQHIQDLKKSLTSKNLTEARKFCYLIQNQAATFGWPFATEISGWFTKLLKKQQEKGLNLAINKLFLDSFDVIIKDNLKINSEPAIKLRQHIESELKIKDI